MMARVSEEGMVDGKSIVVEMLAFCSVDKFPSTWFGEAAISS